MKAAFCLSLLFAGVAADLYMQNPRGSNNRLQEENTNRNNANRLFDSQNNGKGGYCQGPAMTYYEGSQLSIEWTNQHGCSNPKLFCNLVIQYMCSASNAPATSLVRDGSGDTTDRIPNEATASTEVNGNGVLTYGLHENYDYYQACETRERNKGLFIADRNLNGRNSAHNTRQNNNGNRHGYECPEERDYYPYWHPTPWKDVAFLTHNTDWCGFVKDESQNKKDKNECLTPEGEPSEFNNAISCKANGHNWRKVKSWGIGAPDCLQAPWGRHNHLGNTVGGFQASYNWTIPSVKDACGKIDNDASCDCVLRMRYNISTADVGGSDGHSPEKPSLTAAQNGDASPVQNDANKYQDGLRHELALDTTQFGRTFQDRSHVFHIGERPSNVPALARIHNLNVRGKRGNIVQTYPATEYDFVPQYLTARANDYIHFQWTGCDHNPNGNAGEGTAQTDRSNIVQIRDLDRSHPMTDAELKDGNALFDDKDVRIAMAYIRQPYTNNDLCKSREELLELNNNNNNEVEQDTRNCAKLNGAPTPYFNGGVQKMSSVGDYYYMSSRNNNFTNRGQKGIIRVEYLLPLWAIIVVAAGSAVFVASGATAGAILYARSHPHSAVASFLAKF